MTGTFKQRPNLKNNVAYGTFITDKMYMTVVAFKDTADAVAKCNATDTYLIEGRLTQNKYNDEWRTQVVINAIKPLGSAQPAQSVENIQSLDEEDVDADLDSGNLDSIDIPNDDLPF